MEDLLEVSNRLIAEAPLAFRRYLFDRINWDNNLIGVKGARGTGKTTMLLQWLRLQGLPPAQRAYFSLDEMYFTGNSLVDTAKSFYLQGGKVLVLDEVHKYPNWATEIKNLHDRYHDLKIVFIGSSIIDISRQEADLSRRAIMYELQGMSYREYLASEHNLSFPALELKTILTDGAAVREIFPNEFRPLANFREYLKFGYYPFYRMDKLGYFQRLRQLARAIVEYDMAEIKGFDIRHAKKILQLLYIIAQQAPFKPNLQHLADKIGIHRNSINNYLYFLQDARLVQLLDTSTVSAVALQKPEKIYLDNTNLFYALSEVDPSVGSLRETFFQNQLRNGHRVYHSTKTDFIVDQKYSFEIGGKGKSRRQIQGLAEAWVVKDDLEFPAGPAIPLWLFGFLY